MNIISHVPDLELCKEMKELWYPQHTLFYWEFIPKQFPKSKESWILTDKPRLDIYYSAPLASEILEKLPDTLYYSFEYNLRQMKYAQGVLIDYISPICDKKAMSTIMDSKEANARAKTWIYLKKNGLI